jgi:hypothetical protein
VILAGDLLVSLAGPSKEEAKDAVEGAANLIRLGVEHKTLMDDFNDQMYRGTHGQQGFDPGGHP